MNRLILATLLITVVYSWEDLKQTLIRSARSILKRKHRPHVENNIDEVVGTALILATLPSNLVLLLITPGSLMAKLLVVLTELLLIGLVVKIVEKILGQSRSAHQSPGIWVAIQDIIVSLPSPSLRVASSIMSNKRLFGTYLKHLTIPILFGIGLKFLTDRLGLEAVQAHSDMLIGVAIGALMIAITIQLLEKFFRSNNLRLFSYFRIALGVLILAVLGNYLV